MPSTVPTPLAAALGLVPTVLDGARRLPVKAVQLPVLCISSALTALDTARREYDDLAERGERLVARLRGTSFDELEDAVEERLEHTPLAKAYDRAEDALETTTAKAGTALRSVGRTAAKAPAAAQKPLSEAKTAVQETLPETTPAAEAPKGVPTPKAPEGSVERVDSAATREVVETVEKVAERTTAPEVTSHEDLPLADYDHMTLGSLRGRLRSLSVPELVQVRDYEKAHADRLPVVTMLDNRIAKLATDAAATPSAGGASAEPTPAPAANGKVAGASDAKTGGRAATKVRTT